MVDINYDSDGLIVQSNGDGGDCMARTGQLYTGIAINPIHTPPITFSQAVGLLEPNKDGILVRYNKGQYASPYDAEWAPGRDQTVPMIIAAGFHKDREFLKRFTKQQLKRVVKFQNKDVFTPESWNNIIRAMFMAGNKWMALLWPLLHLGDLFTLINTLIICFWKARTPGPILTYLGKYHWAFISDYPPNQWGMHGAHGDNNVGDDICHIQNTVQASKSLPTLVSFLSQKIYKAFRPHGIQYALDVYHRPESGGNPLNVVYKEVVESL